MVVDICWHTGGLLSIFGHPTDSKPSVLLLPAGLPVNYCLGSFRMPGTHSDTDQLDTAPAS